MERHQYDENQPKGKMSLANLRNSMRGLHQLDMLPLRPRAKQLLDDFEYSTDASIQAEWTGTGVTVTSEGATVQEGNYSGKMVIDGTGNREAEKTQSLDLSAYTSVTIWERSSTISDTFQFYVQDSGGDESYWNITANGTANTWQQDTITLASPDANNGTNATLSDITAWGFRQLTASATYYFDTVTAIVGMTIAVEGTKSGDFYKNVYLTTQPLEVDVQSAPTITAPTTNPRIDILTIDSAGTLAWTTGTEATTPSAPWSSVSQGKIPICTVYCKTTMTKVLDFEDKDTDTNQGYIHSDLRPFLNTGFTWQKGSDVASGTSIALGDGNFFDITGTTTIQTITAKNAGTVVTLQFDGALTVSDGVGNLKLNGDFSTATESTLTLVSDGTNWFEVCRNVTASTFLELTDAPSTYSGQGLKVLRVNTGATAIEFVTFKFEHLNDAPSYSGNAGKVLACNTGETALEFVTNGNEFSAGDVLLAQANTERTSSAGSTSWQLAKEILCPFAGALRFSFDLKINTVEGSNPSATARIYRGTTSGVQGTAVGTERVTNSATYTTYSEDISGWSSGEFIQLWYKMGTSAGSRSAVVRNFTASATNPYTPTVVTD